MKQRTICKTLTVAVIILFLGVGIQPGIAVDKSIKPISSGNTLYVGGNGTGNYTTIQSAINNSSDGDTVFVYGDSSPYYENIVIDKSIDLVGEDMESTVIDGGGSGNTVEIISDNSVIRDLSITKGSNGIYLNSSCEYNDINNNTIKENTIGIYLNDECKYNIIDSNIIENNTGDGIHLHFGGGSNDNDFNEIFFEKCNRCWVHDPSVGQQAGHPTICDRCHSAIQIIGQGDDTKG